MGPDAPRSLKSSSLSQTEKLFVGENLSDSPKEMAEEHLPSETEVPTPSLPASSSEHENLIAGGKTSSETSKVGFDECYLRSLELPMVPYFTSPSQLWPEPLETPEEGSVECSPPSSEVLGRVHFTSASQLFPETQPGRLFVGGISSVTEEEALKEYFCQFGDIERVWVMRDHSTGTSKRFGFVQFVDPASGEEALKCPKHVICGKLVDVKRAIPRHSQSPHQGREPISTNTTTNNGNGVHYNPRKIFVGGLPNSINEEEFRNHFQQFGEVMDAFIMHKGETGRPRGFGFIVFSSTEAVDEALKLRYHQLKGKMVEVKRAMAKEYCNNPNAINVNSTSFPYNHSGYQVGYYPQFAPGYYAPSPYYGYTDNYGYPYMVQVPTSAAWTPTYYYNMPQFIYGNMPVTYPSSFNSAWPGFQAWREEA